MRGLRKEWIINPVISDEAIMTTSVQKICLSCKFFRIRKSQAGLCRWTDRTASKAATTRPEVSLEHCCDNWEDAGQEYYIRLGWLKFKQQDRDHNESAIS